MIVRLGIDNFKKSKGTIEDVNWEINKTVNGHALVVGMSGAGKTYTLRKIINNFSHQAMQQGRNDFRVHVFDVHGDIRCINESMAFYSEVAGFGINPLEINPDPHFGGVRKRINQFLLTLQDSTAKMGVKQEAIAYKILEDLFYSFGFDSKDSSTWSLQSDSVIFLDVDYNSRDDAKRLGARWNGPNKSWYIESSQYVGEITKYQPKDMGFSNLKRYPTLNDAYDFFNKKLEQIFLGVGSDAVKAIQAFHRATGAYNRLMNRYHDTSANHDEEKLQNQIENAGARVLDSINDYIQSGGTKKNLDDAIMFSSADSLNSVTQRIGSLIASGIFQDNPPPLDPNMPVHRHDLRTLSHEEQKMFTLFSVEKIFNEAVQKGETDKIRDVIVIDEASKFFDDDPRNPINYTVLEARKFGVALISAGQDLGQFSQEYLGSVATKIILGLDEMHWDAAKRKLNLDRDRMKWVTPQKQLVAQIKEKGVPLAPWKSVSLE